jgi:phosphatidylethanolamine-binding protein (PEBP) family uncharacterized protein
MHHVDAQDVAKWYWTLYDIPPDIHALAKNVQAVGTLGTNSVNNRVGYAPPHSAGAGLRTYVYTLYALSTLLALSVTPEQVTLAVLLDAMKGHVLGTAEIRVVYTRSGNGEEGKGSISPAPPPR